MLMASSRVDLEGQVDGDNPACTVSSGLGVVASIILVAIRHIEDPQGAAISRDMEAIAE